MIYASQIVRVATKFKGHTNGGSSVHVEYLVDTTEPGSIHPRWVHLRGWSWCLGMVGTEKSLQVRRSSPS